MGQESTGIKINKNKESITKSRLLNKFTKNRL